MTVGDLGPSDVVTIDRDSTLGDAVEKLESENVGALVVTEGNSPEGILTDRDAALAINEGGDVASVSVEDAMTGDPVTLREDDEAIEISRAIGEHNVRRVPVVDENDELTGIVTHDDLVATIGEQLDNVADTIEVQSPDYNP